jgi:hypothetical protein
MSPFMGVMFAGMGIMIVLAVRDFGHELGPGIGFEKALFLGQCQEIQENSDGLEEIRTPDLRHVKATS